MRAVVGLHHTPCAKHSVAITFFGEPNDGDSRSSLADSNVVDDIGPHIIGITESWVTNDVTLCWIGSGRLCKVGKARNRKKERRSVIVHQIYYTSIMKYSYGRKQIVE